MVQVMCFTFPGAISSGTRLSAFKCFQAIFFQEKQNHKEMHTAVETSYQDVIQTCQSITEEKYSTLVHQLQHCTSNAGVMSMNLKAQIVVC